MMRIIVAKYNENVEWTKQLPNVIIYNKGSKIGDEYVQIPLKNVGREGHTYYEYIYNNYDSLPDYVAFLQGNPFDHSPNVINNLNDFINSSTKPDFVFLSERVLDCKLGGCVHHPDLPLHKIYKYLFNRSADKNTNFTFGAGAQFIVSKNLILKRPRDFYLKIIKILEYNVNPIEGFVIERFHKLIFSDDTEHPPLPKYKKIIKITSINPVPPPVNQFNLSTIFNQNSDYN